MEKLAILEDERGLVDVDLTEVYKTFISCQKTPKVMARFKKREDLAHCTKSILNFRIKTLTGRTIQDIAKEISRYSKDTNEVSLNVESLTLLSHFLILHSNGITFSVQKNKNCILSSPPAHGYMESTRIDSPLINRKNTSASSGRSSSPTRSSYKTPDKISPSTRNRSTLKSEYSTTSSSKTTEDQPSDKFKYVVKLPISKKTGDASWWNLVSILVYVCVCLSVCLGSHHLYLQTTPKFRLYGESDKAPESHWAEARHVFNSKLKQIRESLPNQNKKSWILISSAVKKAVSSSPDYPAVLLLLANHTADQTSACLATSIAKAAATVLGDAKVNKDIVVKAVDLANTNTHKNKQHLTESLHSILSLERSVAILGLDLFSPEVAMTLHAFTDNSNAPYKRAVIVMTVEDHTRDRSLHPDQRAENILVDSWGQALGEDKVYALVSRLAVNVVEVQPELPSQVKLICPLM